MTHSDPVDPPAAAEQLVLNSPDEARSLKDFALWGGLILLVSLTVYSTVLNGKFIWDDDRYVEKNIGLQSAEGLGNVWTAHWQYLLADSAQRPKVRVYTPQYYPMTHTSYWLEYQFSGAKPDEINTTVFHVDNVLLHVGGAILLWFVLRELQVPGAWVAAAIWALHPVNVESVAWISERKNVLAGAFFFGAMLAYLKAGLVKSEESEASSPDISLYAASLVLFTLAVLSKTVACSLPAVLLLIIWWKRGRIARRDVLMTLPMFVIGLAMAMMTSWVEKNVVRAEGPDYALSLVQRFLIAGNAIWFYVGKVLLPLNLTFIYPRWNVSPSRPELWIGPIGVIVVLAALFALRNKIGRAPFAAALIYVGMLFPALGFFNFYPMRYSFVADHFQYLAEAALITLLVSLGAALVRKVAEANKTAPYLVAGVVLLAMTVLAALRAPVFASSFDLWRDVVAKNSDSWMAHNNYGMALLTSSREVPPDRAEERTGLLDDAMKQFERTLEIKPDHERAWNNWGQALLERGKPDEAISKLQHGLAINPNNVEALMALGTAQFQLKDLDGALATYQLALRKAQEQRPTTPRTRAAAIFHSLGKILQAKGDYNAAAPNLARAVGIIPEAAEYHFDLAEVMAKLGKLAPAAEAYAGAIRLRPDFIDARIGLARLMLQVDNLDGARQQLVAAARINAGYPPLMEAAKAFDVAVRKREAAASQPATTRATTDPTTAALGKMLKTQDITSEVFTVPATQPSR